MYIINKYLRFFINKKIYIRRETQGGLLHTGHTLKDYQKDSEETETHDR